MKKIRIVIFIKLKITNQKIILLNFKNIQNLINRKIDYEIILH